MGVVFCSHQWVPDVSAGWRWCTCKHRCGWRRIVTSIPGDDEVEYVREDLVQDFEPICEVVDK